MAATGYWKPVQTGIECDDDTATVRALAACGPEEVWDQGIRLERPIAPHLAARLVDRVISVESVLGDGPDDEGRAWVVEGAGGVLVPLNDTETMATLMERLGLPAVVVTRSTLGTINHTLLTLEALRTRGIRVAGIVMVGPRNLENRNAVEVRGGAPVVAELPLLSPLTPASLADWTMRSLGGEWLQKEMA